MVLSLQGIRRLALQHGYKEVDWNETSRVVSFRRGSTRINVYYTTGTVGTCLNHPKRGKTQLFRRNLSNLEELVAIFENPRTHTGAGYYTRNSIRQDWKNSQTNQFLVDSARRWLYVGAATGLVQNEREGQTITEICTRWDNLLWNRGSLPDLRLARYGCGSHGGLFLMLYKVVQDTFGDFEVYLANDVNQYLQQKRTHGNYHIVQKPEPKKSALVCREACQKLQAFQEAHSADVQTLQRLIMSLRKEVRVELTHWFLCRERNDHYFTNLDVLPLQSKYHDALHFAHVEYGKLNYPGNQNLCEHCGVIASD